MKISEFKKGPPATVGSMAGGTVFFFEDDLSMRAAGLPDPDPSTCYIIRLADGWINGVGKGDSVSTCAAVLVPDPL